MYPLPTSRRGLSLATLLTTTAALVFGGTAAAGATDPVLTTVPKTQIAPPWHECREHTSGTKWICESDTGGWLFTQRCKLHGGTLVNGGRCEVPIKP